MSIVDVLAGKATWAIEQGDCRELLRAMPPKSVQCCVTSPPYLGLRSYLPAGHPDKAMELGSERTPDEYVAKIVAVFAEVKRVLRDDGVIWVVIGDSYAGGGRGFGYGGKQDTNKGCDGMPKIIMPEVLTSKNLVGIPWRVAFALQADGWYLRSDCIWAKTNPMPESVTDRPTKSHEYIFLLSKRPKYFYDSVAIQEPNSREYWKETVGPRYMTARDGRNDGEKRCGDGNPTGRNKRTVWTIASELLRDEHYAAYPTTLVLPCILAGSSERSCATCGKAWRRVVEKTRSFESGSGKSGHLPVGKNGLHLQGDGETRDVRMGVVVHSKTLGFAPACSCPSLPPIGSVVLDPFAGSGTTILTALRHGRRAIGVDLSEKYVEMARRRVTNDCPMLNAAGVVG